MNDGGSPPVPPRIAARLADLPRHLVALREAMAEFGADFDLDEFVYASASTDPDELKRAYVVERAFEVLQNYMVELASAALKVAAIASEGEQPNARRDFARMREAGVMSANRCERLIRLQEIRNLMAHEYTQAQPRIVHEGVLLLVAELPGFLADYRRWLQRLGFRSP